MLRDIKMDGEPEAGALVFIAGTVLQPLAISAVAFGLGYQVHSYFSTRALTTSSKAQRKASTSQGSSSKRSGGGSDGDSEIVDASDSESDAEDEAAARASDISSVRASLTEEVKLVLVVNDSLKMSKGKIAAQAGHATLACAMMLKDVNPKVGQDSLASSLPSAQALIKTG